jgi:subtilisin family serine protease
MTRVLLLTILMLGCAAQAQILPRVPAPALPGGLPGTLPGDLGGAAGLPALTQQTEGALTDDGGRLERARKLQIRLLLRRDADVVEADPNGEPIVRGEVLAFSPADAVLAHALGAGFSIVRDRSLGTLGIRIVVLAVPRGTATRRALILLRQSDPGGTYDFNNIYMESGEAGGAGTATADSGGGSRSAAATPLGLVDGGVGTAQPVFEGAIVHRHGCGGEVIPSAHGTEVASLMVGRSARFGGAAPGAALFAADVYCGKPTGGAVDSIAEALEWLADQRVPVINVSLVGPPNALLQQVIARMVARGFLIVAAVGNDGPAAPPLYPAAYTGVVGVTAVDARRRVIFEAERGPQVMFAAPGADIPAATLPDDFRKVRGTSFAAPLVAGLLAERLQDMAAGKDPGPAPAVDPAAARAAIDALAQAAIHLGAPGRNTIFGYGLVGADLPSAGSAARE